MNGARLTEFSFIIFGGKLDPKTILYLHGFASSGQGTKATHLRRRLAAVAGVTFHAPDFNPTPKDFEYVTVTGMINRLRQYVLDHELSRLYLIGSSMGGLVGLNYAHRFGGVEKMLLLAPALVYPRGLHTAVSAPPQPEEAVTQFFHYAFNRAVPLRHDLERDGRFFQHPPPPPAPILVIHGRSDEIISIAGSRQYVVQNPNQVRLVEVEAGHDLNPHLELIWQEVERFLLA